MSTFKQEHTQENSFTYGALKAHILESTTETIVTTVAYKSKKRLKIRSFFYGKKDLIFGLFFKHVRNKKRLFFEKKTFFLTDLFFSILKTRSFGGSG